MGDRTNPIKFGPEWLRNLSRERNASNSAGGGPGGSANSGSPGGTLTGPSTSGSPAAAGSPGRGSSHSPGARASGSSVRASTSSTSNVTNSTNTSSKILLAKLRYGREEMLALYDRTSEAPPQLKAIDILYQPKGKPPFALNNSFEEETRETLRSAPHIGGIIPGDRFGFSRGRGVPTDGRGRGMGIPDRGRPNKGFVRQSSVGRDNSTWHTTNPRNSFGLTDEDQSAQLRSWNNTNGIGPNPRNVGDQPEWANKMYRSSKRQGNNTNWRQQPSREDGDEWRSSEAGRAREHHDKWDRDWGERLAQDKQSSWNSNRRIWAGDQMSEDNLPEWAVENAEACGGTFDSSGAFHGYSNDDTNLPKNQDALYPLTRSHTHGSFGRSKTVEEGSDEWWASEKAKKLSPKRFDASEIKFKKQASSNMDGGDQANSNFHAGASDKDDSSQMDSEKQEVSGGVSAKATTPDIPVVSAIAPDIAEPDDENYRAKFQDKSVPDKPFPDNKNYDPMQKKDETTEERGNFQSVMIPSNNLLRQRHQNMGPPLPMSDSAKRHSMNLMQMLDPKNAHDSNQVNHQKTKEKLAEDFLDMSLQEDISVTGASMSDSSVMPTSMHDGSNSMAQMPNAGHQLRVKNPIMNQGLVLVNNQNKPSLPSPGLPQPSRIQSQPVGITNSMLNASLGLPIGPSNSMGIPMPGMSPSVIPNSGMPGMAVGMQAGAPIPGFAPAAGMPGISSSQVGNMANSSLFLGQGQNSSMQPPSEIPMPNHTNQSNLFPMHGLQPSQSAFSNSIYGNLMPQSPGPMANLSGMGNLTEQWYYEDPEKTIQGPFSSKEMYNWYRAGFFSPSLMVRRACEAVMRPLGTYGPMPFGQFDMFQLSGGFDIHPQGDNLLNSQQALGLDVMNTKIINKPAMEMQVGPPAFGPQQPQRVDPLWGQPSSSDMLWMQQMNSRNESSRRNNLHMFFWDHQPTAMTSNSLIPEEIAKEMKTEDQILAQLRANQNMGPPQNFVPDQRGPAVKEEEFSAPGVAPNLEELQKLIQDDPPASAPLTSAEPKQDTESQKPEKPLKKEDSADISKLLQPTTAKPAVEVKPKPAKSEPEKPPKNKENTNIKSKKKGKEEKKEEPVEISKAEERDKTEAKRSQESSPSKNKKDDKLTKKDLDREKKEWIKDGFTVVKTEKSNNKDSKKKAEEARVAEEAERKRKEEEKLVAEEERKKKLAETLKRQQEMQQAALVRQASESVVKKAPWSVSNPGQQAPSMEGLTLAEIQRLEREKKLEQLKEQQHMMAMLAHQKALSQAREQFCLTPNDPDIILAWQRLEMSMPPPFEASAYSSQKTFAPEAIQAAPGWAKKKTNNAPGQSLTEIQAEARKAQAMTFQAQALEDLSLPAPSAPAHTVSWGASHNGGGFWDTQLNVSPTKAEKPLEAPKAEPTKKKKVVSTPPVVAPKKETTPAVEFEGWCTTTLTSYSSKIDVPTFVGFLKDIESPYEVKDYVKCYLGETKESSDFARQFLERRSKLLRVGMVTPSDDLCSPAMAINPRTPSLEYQEVKGKAKKTKKNKMLKVDARILGFSVTASEDRINVGDIDTA